MKKILLVNDQFENGGAGRVAATLCNELIRIGYDLHIVTDCTNFNIRYQIHRKIPIHSVCFINRKTGVFNRLLSLFKTAKAIRPIIQSVEPDVIIAIQANGFIRTWIANRGIRIPLIAADHTSFARKMDFINTLTRHYLYRYADGLSILTKRDERLLGDKYPHKKVIYNPLSYPLLAEKTLRDKTILCAGRFDIWKIKGFDTIIRIWANLAPKYPQWTLEFAGTGKDESIKYIQDLIDNQGLKGRVRILGQINDMKTLYSHSGIFALPSRIEGFPMVLLEAMSQGCPCVAFNVGGASEEMIEKDCGYVIQDGDTKGFESALSELMMNNEKRKLYSENAIRSVEKFSLENHLQSWIALIEETIERKK